MTEYPFHLHTIEEAIEHLLSAQDNKASLQLVRWLTRLKAQNEAIRITMEALGPVYAKYG